MSEYEGCVGPNDAVARVSDPSNSHRYVERAPSRVDVDATDVCRSWLYARERAENSLPTVDAARVPIGVVGYFDNCVKNAGALCTARLRCARLRHENVQRVSANSPSTPIRTHAL